MNLEMHLKEGEQMLARIWKAALLRGAVAIAFAVAILVWPNLGQATLIALFGACALLSGLATIAGAFNLPVRSGERAWLVFEGLLGLAVGVVVFVWPDLSALGLLYVIAAWAIAMGVVEVGLAFVLPLSGGRSLLIVLGGLLSVAFGVIMFGHPGAGAVALLALIAAFALVTGVMQIAFALELRRVVAELDQRFRPRGGQARDAGLGEESEMQTIHLALATALVAPCVGALMVHAGVAERQLARRPRRANRERGRRP